MEIRFLLLSQIDALVDAARRGMFAAIDCAIQRTAAMTRLRQGELLALRWRDVDWTATCTAFASGRGVLGEFGTRSPSGQRSVPMADEVAGALDRLFKDSRWQADDDLVFADQATGAPPYADLCAERS